jgi:hypothetical protein
MLHGIAEANGMVADSAAARQFVKAKWEEIVRNPAASVEFRSIVFGAIREAALKPAPTTSERIAAAAFSEYIRQRKMYQADIALNMYDTWKPVNDREMAARRTGLTNLFYLGNMPFDFERVVVGALGLGGFSIAALAAGASSAAYGSAIVRSQAQVVAQFFLLNRNTPHSRTSRTFSNWRPGQSEPHVSAVYELEGVHRSKRSSSDAGRCELRTRALWRILEACRTSRSV